MPTISAEVRCKKCGAFVGWGSVYYEEGKNVNVQEIGVNQCEQCRPKLEKFVVQQTTADK